MNKLLSLNHKYFLSYLPIPGIVVRVIDKAKNSNETLLEYTTTTTKILAEEICKTTIIIDIKKKIEEIIRYNPIVPDLYSTQENIELTVNNKYIFIFYVSGEREKTKLMIQCRKVVNWLKFKAEFYVSFNSREKRGVAWYIHYLREMKKFKIYINNTIIPESTIN